MSDNRLSRVEYGEGFREDVMRNRATGTFRTLGSLENQRRWII